MPIKRLKWIVDIVFLTLSIWIVSGIITDVLSYRLYRIPVPERKMERSFDKDRHISSRGPQYYAVIQQRNLFHAKEIDTVSRAKKSEEDIVRPLAEMGLVLRGTITGPKELERAIIEDNGKQDLYKLGETIKGATIVAIYRNKVIMNVGGQEQMLVVAEEARPGTKTAARKISGGKYMPRGGISPGFADVMQHLDRYIGKARIVPYFKGGKPYGFRINNVAKNTQIYRLGVRSGDIIKSVNGMPIRTPEDAFKAYQDIKNSTSMDVEVERGGSPLRLTIPLK